MIIFLATILQGVNQAAQLKLGNFAPSPVSVGELFAGALLPGMLLVVLYLAWIAIVAFRRPEACPSIPMTVAERAGLGRNVVVALLFPLLLILSVLGSILAGIATATELASIGALGAVRSAPRATYLANAVAGSHQDSHDYVDDLRGPLWAPRSSPWYSAGSAARPWSRRRSMRFRPGGAFGAMVVCMAVMFVLGFFLDTFEIMFIMVPIFGPPLLLFGLDPIWLA